MQDVIDKIDKIIKSARVQEAANNRTRTLVRFRLDLSEAKTWKNPYDYSGAFKSLLVERVSDPSAICYFKPNSPSEEQDHVELGMRDSWAIDTVAAKAIFSWPAQPGKWIDIVLFFDSTFSSGSYTQVSAGGVSISTGTSIVSRSLSVGQTPTIILPASSTRKSAVIQKLSPGMLYLGDSLVTAGDADPKQGLALCSGNTFVWTNSAALYGITGTDAIAYGNKVIVLEEF